MTAAANTSPDFVPRQVSDTDPIGAIRARWLYLVAAVMVCAGLGWSVGRLQPVVHTAQVEVTLTPLDGASLNPDSRTASQLADAMNSEAGSVESATVLRAVGTKLGITSSAAANDLRSTAIVNSESLVISFRSGNAATAELGVRTAAEQYLSARAATSRRSVIAQVTNLQRQLRVAADRLATAPTNRAQLIRYASRVAALGPQLRDIRTFDISGGTVTTAVQTSSPNVVGRLAVYTFGAALVALLVGAGVIAWFARRAKLVSGRTSAFIRGCPVLGVVPLPPDGEARDQAALANAYVGLRTAVISRHPRRGPIALMYAASETALGATSARSVAAQLRRSLLDASYVVAHVDERVPADRPAGMTDLPRFRSVLDALDLESDFVLATVPAADTAAGLTLASAVGTVLLLAIDGSTPIRRCDVALSRLRALGVDVLGIALTSEAAPSRDDAAGDGADDTAATPLARSWIAS